MRFVLPAPLHVTEQFQIGFVDQRGGVDGLAGPPIAQLPMRDSPQLVIDEGKEVVGGFSVSPAMRLK